ncbi:hypothetical protein ACFLRU_05435 [Bacteroidota bacterium]
MKKLMEVKKFTLSFVGGVVLVVAMVTFGACSEAASALGGYTCVDGGLSCDYEACANGKGDVYWTVNGKKYYSAESTADALGDACY